MTETDLPDWQDYHKQFGLTEQRLKQLKTDAIIMHPGPMNRGVEIAPIAADAKNSVIREQVSNGVTMRMVLLDWIMQQRQQ